MISTPLPEQRDNTQAMPRSNDSEGCCLKRPIEGARPHRKIPLGAAESVAHTLHPSTVSHVIGIDASAGNGATAVVKFSEAKPALSPHNQQSVCGTSQPQKTTGCTPYQRSRALTTKPIRKNLPGAHLKNEGVSPLQIHPLHRKLPSPSHINLSVPRICASFGVC